MLRSGHHSPAVRPPTNSSAAQRLQRSRSRERQGRARSTPSRCATMRVASGHATQPRYPDLAKAASPQAARPTPRPPSRSQVDLIRHRCGLRLGRCFVRAKAVSGQRRFRIQMHPTLPYLIRRLAATALLRSHRRGRKSSAFLFRPLNKTQTLRGRHLDLTYFPGHCDRSARTAADPERETSQTPYEAIHYLYE